MSRSVRISLKDAQRWLQLGHEYGGSDMASETQRLRDALKPKRSVKASRVRRETKRLTKKEKRGAIYNQVAARADGVCECGCFRPFTATYLGMPEMDHFEGVARSETLETCWMLRADCHRAKHRDGNPSAWRAKFINHCLRHGYRKTAEKVGAMVAADALIEEAAALSRTGGAP